MFQANALCNPIFTILTGLSIYFHISNRPGWGSDNKICHPPHDITA